MSQFIRWLAMGGYSLSIWSAYALVCTVLVISLLDIKVQRARTRKKIQQWLKGSNNV